ncbi:MAG: helicase HerA-like domain-containing protein, partial [Planctomycetota bacterium]
KGDIGNLLLTFPEFQASDYREYLDPAEATRKGMTVDELAKSKAKLWKSGLADWGQDGDRIRRLQQSADVTIYTPGSNVGVPLTVLKSFDAPPADQLTDADAMRERITGAASGLLTLMGVDADPLLSPEHILVSSILDHCWREGRSVTIEQLIGLIQSPPISRVGVMDLDSFMSPASRASLAMRLNNLLASPAFSTWMQGESLSIERLLHTPDGKPRISVLSIAHLSDSERMFFVTIVLNELLSWMRTQSGTSSLRALFYMDEVYGYFPPSAKPPSKPPMLTLLKQARAFGLGICLATQNPVDLDYKGLSNIGTWFLGRLQTQRDKDRVLDGLEGAAIQTGAQFDKSEMDKMLAGLGNRVFLMNNVHDDGPSVFHTRWALSFLSGPLS